MSKFRFNATKTYEEFKHSSEDEDSLKKLNTTPLSTFDYKKISKNAIGDVTEIRRPILHSLCNKAGLLGNNDDTFANIAAVRSKHSWNMTTNKRLANALNHNEDNDVDSDVPHYQNNSYMSTVLDSVQSKHEHNDLRLNSTEDATEDEVLVTTNNYNSVLEKSPSRLNSTHTQSGQDSQRVNTNILLTDGHVDYVTLFALTVGLSLSKILHYFLIYFTWILRQIYQLRYFFLKDCGVLEFYKYQDASFLSFRTKMWLLPILAAGWLFYICVTFLQYAIRLVLNQVPNCLVVVLHKIFREI